MQLYNNGTYIRKDYYIVGSEALIQWSDAALELSQGLGKSEDSKNMCIENFLVSPFKHCCPGGNCFVPSDRI